MFCGDGTHLTGPPKTDAGLRVVAIPESVVDELRKHLVTVPEHPDALVFGRPGGRPFRRATLYTTWHAATKRLGMEGLHIHDLRHAGQWRSTRAWVDDYVASRNKRER